MGNGNRRCRTREEAVKRPQQLRGVIISFRLRLQLSGQQPKGLEKKKCQTTYAQCDITGEPHSTSSLGANSVLNMQFAGRMCRALMRWERFARFVTEMLPCSVG